MSTIKKNFLYSSILTAANYIFPFLTYPYVSRILGVTNIGICNFVDGIVNYFILFSMMGISTIGIREVAKNKNDKNKLSQTFSSLFLLNTISTSIMLIVLIISIYTVPQLYEYKHLLFVGAFKLIGNYLLIEWLYTGLEDFKYITVRTILVKCLYVIVTFVFIKNSDDYPLYYLFMVLMVAINSIFNIVHSRRFISFTFKQIDFKPYVKPFLILGVYALLTSMYTSFNVAYLGFEAGPKEVGFYTTAVKIYAILLALFTAFTNVMLPRMSSLLSEGKMEDFKRMIHKSIDALLGFSMPLIIISVVFAPQIIYIISGDGYQGAITPMRIVMPLMFVIGYAQILVIQILMPLRKDKAIFINSMLGAIIGIGMNLLLVPTLKSTGSAMVWVISELVVTFSAQHFVFNNMGLRFPARAVLKNVLYALPAVGIACVIYRYIEFQAIIKLAIAGFLILTYCTFVQIKCLKNPLFTNLLQRFGNMTNKELRQKREGEEGRGL